MHMCTYIRTQSPPPQTCVRAFRCATGVDFAAISIQIGNFMITSGRCTLPANGWALPQHSFRPFNRAAAPLNGLSNARRACYVACGSAEQQRLVQLADWTAAHTHSHTHTLVFSKSQSQMQSSILCVCGQCPPLFHSPTIWMSNGWAVVLLLHFARVSFLLTFHLALHL